MPRPLGQLRGQRLHGDGLRARRASRWPACSSGARSPSRRGTRSRRCRPARRPPSTAAPGRARARPARSVGDDARASRGPRVCAVVLARSAASPAATRSATAASARRPAAWTASGAARHASYSRGKRAATSSRREPLPLAERHLAKGRLDADARVRCGAGDRRSAELARALQRARVDRAATRARQRPGHRLALPPARVAERDVARAREAALARDQSVSPCRTAKSLTGFTTPSF